ncbi:hypothetical protein IL094_001734 [Enterococcus faecalis]|nr:hypothetical protein [Enterococcus faecalis]
MAKIKFPDFLSASQKKQLQQAIELGKPVLIKGPQGPTGKTTIANFLRNQGVLAFEEWECVTLELDSFID